MPVEESLTLTEELRAPAHARAWVAARTPHAPRDAADDALLIVSELVTNAVRHGLPDIVLRLELHDDRLRIEVYDAGDELPSVPSVEPDVDRATGRGLLIVAATAADWGVTRSDERPGKSVWAEVRLDVAASY